MSSQMPPGQQTFVDRVWSTVVRPEILGGICLVAGGLLVGGAVGASGGGWRDPLRVSSLLPLVAGLAALAAILAVGLVWDRHAETRPVEGAGRRDWAGRTLPAVGATSMVTGAAMLLASWFLVQADAPPGSLTVPIGETAEAFEARIAGEGVEVMLPMRVHLEDLSMENGPEVEIAFSTPGRDPFGGRRMSAGETVAMEGYRLAPVGLSPEQGNLRATVASRRDETISTAVAEGERFKLSPQGPEYRAAEIVRNYMETLGPAVRIENDELGSAWVFERGAGGGGAPEFEHDLYVEGLQRMPGVRFAVTPDFPLWPIGLGGGLFVVGIALLVACPERVRRGGRRESLNEAGGLFEESTIDEEAV